MNREARYVDGKIPQPLYSPPKKDYIPRKRNALNGQRDGVRRVLKNTVYKELLRSNWKSEGEST